jgi:hypothetical protein
MIYEVRRYNPQLKGNWDDLVRRAKNGNFLFFRDYMDYHRDKFEDHSLMFYRDGNLLSCLPANIAEKTTLHSHQGLTYGGLLMHPKNRLEDVRSFMWLLVAYLREQSVDGLVYNPAPYIYHRLPAEEDLVALSEVGARIIATKAICAVRIDSGATLSYNRKRDVTRFRKSGMSVAQSYDFADFMRLCEANLRERFNANPVHAPMVMQSLADNFPNHIKLYAVSHQSRMIAGAIIYLNSGCAKLQYIAYNDIGKEVGAVAAVYDHILKLILQPNTWLEFGHSITPAGKFAKGVHEYKESFGARTIQRRTYFLDLKAQIECN